MSRDMSFGQRLDAGWSMIELMEYYALTNSEYDRVLASLQEIRKSKVRK